MWANAWLAGKAAPDDVLDALSLWAPKQSVTAYDAVAAGHTGLPWPDVNDAGTVSLLQTLRAAVGRQSPARPAACAGRSTWFCRYPATCAGCPREHSSSGTRWPRARR